MAFDMISKVVNGVKGGVVSALKGSTDIGSMSVKLLRDITISTLKGAGELIETGIHVPASIISGASRDPGCGQRCHAAGRGARPVAGRAGKGRLDVSFH